MFKDNVLVDVYEEETVSTPQPKPQIPYVPKPGSIQRNSHYVHNNRGGKSVDQKRRVASVYDEPQYKQSGSRVGRELHPLIPRGPKKVNKTTHTAEL